jgi:hypothetical protein
MSVVVVTPPPLIVSRDLAKKHLRIDNDAEDILIDVYLAAAQAAIDGPMGWLGRCVGVQTLEARFDGFTTPIWSWNFNSQGLFWGGGDNFAFLNAAFPSGRIELPFPPLIEVLSVTYEDGNGRDVVLPSADYLALNDGLEAAYGMSFPSGRWTTNAVRVQYRAGYDFAPPAIEAALLLMTGDLYNNRETVETGVRAAAVQVPMSTTVQNLLGPFRVWG